MQVRYFTRAVLKTAFRAYKRKFRSENFFITDRALGKWSVAPSVPAGAEVIWIDVFSGGEATQVVTLCKLLKQRRPSAYLVLTTNNRYAADFTSEHNPDVDLIWDSPWDLEVTAKVFLSRLHPSLLVFVENCTLPIVAKTARRSGVPTVLISGLVNEKFREHPIYVRPFQEHFHHHIDRFLLKSDEDTAFLQAQGIPSERYEVLGNLKFDPTFTRIDEDHREKFRKTLNLPEDQKLLVAGSLHPKEPSVVLEAFAKIKAEGHPYRLVIVPRYNSLAGEIETEARARKLSVTRYSELRKGAPFAADVLLVDGFGLLVKFYNIASLSVIGGSFFRRSSAGFSQNLIEPVLAGCPVFFGPYTSQFEDVARMLVEFDDSFRSDETNLGEHISRFLRTPGKLGAFRQVSERLIQLNKENIEKTCRELIRLLDGGMKR